MTFTRMMCMLAGTKADCRAQLSYRAPKEIRMSMLIYRGRRPANGMYTKFCTIDITLVEIPHEFMLRIPYVSALSWFPPAHHKP